MKIMFGKVWKLPWLADRNSPFANMEFRILGGNASEVKW
jgi:hypothetical protein